MDGHRVSPPAVTHGIRWFLLLIIPLILLSGVLLIAWEIRMAQETMRSHVLREARQAAQALNPSRIDAVMREATWDPPSPTYQRLARQLQILQETHPGILNFELIGRSSDGENYRIMGGKSDPSVVSCALNMEAAFAGETLMCIPLALNKQQAITACAPVYGAFGEDIIAVLRTTHDPAPWARLKHQAIIEAVLLSLALLCIAVLASLCRFHIPVDHERSGFLSRYYEALLMLVAGFVLSLYAADIAHDYAHRSKQQAFEQLADSEMAQFMRQWYRIRDDYLVGIARFLEASDDVDQETFSHFVSPILENSLVYAVAWVPIVKTRMPGDGLWGLDEAGNRISVPMRDYYFPVELFAPHGKVKEVDGFDLMTDQARKTALEDVLLTGYSSSTPPIHLAHDPDGKKMILTYYPVRREHNGKIIGMVSLIVDPEKLLTSIYRQHVIHVDFLMQTKKGTSHVLARYWDAPVDDREMTVAQSVGMFGHIFQVVTHPGPDFESVVPLVAFGRTFMSGMILTFALALIIVFPMRQRIKLRQLVSARTADLGESQAVLERKLKYEEILYEISTLAMEDKDADSFLQQVLRRLGEGLDVSRAYIFKHDHAQDAMSNTHEWVAPGISAEIGNLQNLPSSLVPWWTDQLKKGNNILFRDIEDIPDEKTREVLRTQHILSVEAVPLFVNDAYFGFIGFDACKEYRYWPEEDVGIITAIARVISHYIERQYYENSLKLSREKLKEQLEALRRGETERARLASAIEQAGETIVVTDTDGIIQYVNPSFTRTSGYTREEAIGQKPSVLKSGKQDEGYYRAMWETIQSGQIWEGRFINKKKNGDIYTEEVTISPVMDDQGEIINYVAVKRDITREMDIEQQLIQSQKMETIGTMAGGIAHDFNNLLQSIIGFTDLALDEKTTPAQRREFLMEVRKAGDLATTLTRQLLAFSRRQVLAKQTVDLPVLIGQMTKMIGRMIGETVQLDLNVHDSMPPVHADPGQIEQIIMNLVVNARDAMPDGGRVTIGFKEILFTEEDLLFHAGARAGRFVRISVSDTGAGMPEHVRKRVFEPFFTTKPSGKGTGLGLSTVYGITRQHDGWVSVYSEEGSGSDFHVYLPVAAGIKNDMPSAPRKETPPAQGQGERILLVEDENGVRHLMDKLLSTHGYIVTPAASAEEALEIYTREQGAFDLVFSDVVLPGQSGFDLVETLKKRNPSVRVLMVSGYTDERTRWPHIREKGWRYLQKPVNRQVLLTTLREIFQGDTPREVS